MKLTERIEVSNYRHVVLHPGTPEARHWQRHNAGTFTNWDDDWYLVPNDPPARRQRGFHTTEEMARMIKHYHDVGYTIILSGDTVNIRR